MTAEHGQNEGRRTGAKSRRRLAAVVFLVVVALSVAVSGAVMATHGTYVDVVGLRGG